MQKVRSEDGTPPREDPEEMPEWQPPAMLERVGEGGKGGKGVKVRKHVGVAVQLSCAR